MMHMQQERDTANKFSESILPYRCHRETCGTYISTAGEKRSVGMHRKQMGGFILETQKKKRPLGVIIIGVFVVVLAAFYIYVHVSTTPEEKAYAAAVQRVVELSDERYQKAQQDEEEEEKESYVEKIARKQEEARPYFDKYRKEYVAKEGEGYLVRMPVQEMLDDKVVAEYTYEIRVEKKDGEYAVVSMDKTEK